MSFILDALKKSETDRQQQTPTAFATVPSSDGNPRVPRWLLLLGALLAINLIVLLGMLLRSDDDPPAQAVTTSNAVETAPSAAVTDFAAQIEAARLNESQRRATPPSTQVQEPSVTATTTAIPVATDTGAKVSGKLSANNTPAGNMPAQQAASLPTIYELQANGSITLPELHLDIHVYSEVPEDRFVFINMSKQREKSQLNEGPTVDEIRPDGVVLDYRGTTFLLPRD
jgi:general secretion pathway protein B